MPYTLERFGILTDEVASDFSEAMRWIAGSGLGHVEVRVIDGRNVADIDDQQADAVRRTVEQAGLRISCVASPLFKCALDPGRAVASGDRFGQQEEGVDAHFAKLERVISIALRLGAPRIRIFSFWREIEPQRHFDPIAGHLRRAAEIAGRRAVTLLLENEPSCNGGFAAEVADLVRRVKHPSLGALWDPGNEAWGGREAFPAGYAQLKGLVAHAHLKDAYIAADGKPRCVPLGSGTVPWIEHFRALAADGYEGLFTLETHFTPAGGTRMTGARMTLDALRTLLGEV